MAFNWKTFQTRTLTAIVFAAVMLTGLLWNYWAFFILFSVIHFGCWWEYLKLTEKIYHAAIDKAIKYFFCVCGYFVFLAVAFSQYTYDFWWTPFGFEISLKWGVIILILVCLFAFLFQNKKLPGKLKWVVLAGLVYISIVWGFFLNLRLGHRFSSVVSDTLLERIQNNESSTITEFTNSPAFDLAGKFFCLFIVIVIWINDTMAYIVGSLIGKTPLSKISPKKTWEGTLGGIILSVVVAGLIFSNYYSDIGSSEIQFHFKGSMWYIVAAITAIFGTLGDLLESKLKRMAGVKDSGSIMPGHGGFLDRFDSLLLAIPAVWLYVYFLM